ERLTTGHPLGRVQAEQLADARYETRRALLRIPRWVAMNPGQRVAVMALAPEGVTGEGAGARRVRESSLRHRGKRSTTVNPNLTRISGRRISWLRLIRSDWLTLDDT